MTWRSGGLVGVLLVVAALLLSACTGGKSVDVSSPSPAPAANDSAANDSAANDSAANGSSANDPSAGSATTAATAPSPSSPTVAVTVPPPPAAPRRLACYDLSSVELTEPTNASRPVPCRRAHTAQTIYVGRLHTEVDGHTLAVDSERVQRQLARVCPARLASYVGGPVRVRRLSRLNVVWFSPTAAQSDEGADWFRCDVVSFSRGSRLADLPRTARLAKRFDRGHPPGRFGLCGTARPGRPHFTRVACGERHSWRALDTVVLAGGARYPGARKVRRAGSDVCRARARRRTDFSLRFSYGWEWPTRGQWAAGQHYGYCWAPDRSSRRRSKG